MILRVLNPAHAPVRVLRERATQNTVAALGYPVPRVLAACADPRPLGAPFLVMERAPGRPLLEAQRVGASRVLAQAHARLHALDAQALLGALDDRAICPRSPGASSGPLSPGSRTACAGSSNDGRAQAAA